MMSLLALLPKAEAEIVVHNIVALFIGLVNRIASIIVQCNHNNNINNEDILKVLSHDLYIL